MSNIKLQEINEKIQRYNDQLNALRAALRESNHALIECLEQARAQAKSEGLILWGIRDDIESLGQEIPQDHLEKEDAIILLITQLEGTQGDLAAQEASLEDVDLIESIGL